jgi:hypothetical protein
MISLDQYLYRLVIICVFKIPLVELETFAEFFNLTLKSRVVETTYR